MKRLLLALIATAALSFGAAQTFEVGYQLDAQGGTPFFYATHDLYLFEMTAIDTQFYLSPSVELTFNRDWWVQAQLLIDSPAFTISARVLYESDGGIVARVGILFGF